MEPLSLQELISATRAQATGFGTSAPRFERVCLDSRQVRSGDLFWALAGSRHDGHDYLAEAQRGGAVACVVSRTPSRRPDMPLLIVGDTLQALADLAQWRRRQSEALVIGVTGSVGKTTTREMIHAVLAARHRGCQSRNNFNNEIGLPLSLLELTSDDEFAVLEMGAARIGDIARLCEIAAPEVGVLTQIGPAHLETFGSLENIYRGKGELLEALPRDGFAVIGGDDDAVRDMARRAPCRVLTVGERPGNALRAQRLRFHPGRLGFTVAGETFEVPAPARHYLLAALCALAVAREIGMESAAIAQGFRRFDGAPGRCRVEEVGPWTLIDDTYNANPLSMQAACVCLRDWPAAGRRMLVAGDMLELGSDSARCHRELGATVAESRIDRLLAFGAQADSVAGGALTAGMSAHSIADCQDLASLLTVLDCWLAEGDVVLVKGSRGMRMERVVHWLREQGAARGPRQTTRMAARAVA